ncbi:MAG: leucine-rich repeat protein [Oscillospiraceae bacterium]|nr:leucine-rich repeat protein [Oscillospiraceae bacterium]
MYCPKCDTPRPYDFRFCRECGSTLIHPTQTKKGKRWPAIAVMALMLSVGIVVYFIGRDTTPATPWLSIQDGTVYFDQSLYDGPSVVEIPSKVDGQVVESIGAESFRDCDTITEVILPDTVRTIHAGAFQDCDELRGVKLPEGLVSIHDEAFLGCDSLEAIYVPGSVATIGVDAFADCPELKHIFFVGDRADWESLYPQSITENALIHSVSGPDATTYSSS